MQAKSGRKYCSQRLLLAMLLPVTNLTGISAEKAADPEPTRDREQEVQFTRSAPYGSPSEIQRHLSYAAIESQYDLRQERFKMLVPANYSTNESWGLLVWVSPGEEPRIPPGWGIELAAERLLLVAACQSGNERPPLERCRLALDATCNMCQRFTIDRQRIYVAGFSGGGRIASALGVGYADLFTGALCICGVDFYEPIPAAAGGFYPASYRPLPNLLLRAKKLSRYVLLTGDQDMNRDNTKSTAENGFKRARFQSVFYLEIPSMKHALPGSDTFRQALKFLNRPLARQGHDRP